MNLRRKTFIIHPSAFIALFFIFSVHAADLAPGFVPLQTELKISGPVVSVRATLGWRYRPGIPFQLKIHVENPHLPFTGEVLVVEGDGDSGPNYLLGKPVVFSQSTREITLPVRAPSVTANVSVVIRSVSEDSRVRPEVFRASLAKILRPLPPGARQILVCGSASAAGGPQDQVASIRASDFPEASWILEGVDWVVLGDDSLKGATPEAKGALREWLFGGGRLFVGSSEALSAAIAARLLPVDPAVGSVGSDLAWWRTHAGLTPADVLAEKNHRPVFARLPLGFGATVFLFPATSPDIASEAGAGMLNRPELQRVRERFPDLRIQPDRFSAFTYGTVGSGRRLRALDCVVLGALVLLVGLALARSGRTVWELAGLPVVFGALVVVLLGHGFPEPELVASRVEWIRQSEDRRATLTQEWTLVEAFRQPALIRVDSPDGGSTVPLFASSDELRSAGYSTQAISGQLQLLDVPVLPEQPLLLQSVSVAGGDPGASGPSIAIRESSNGATLQLRGALATDPPRKVAIWVRPDRTMWLLSNVGSEGGFSRKKYNPPALREALINMGNETAVKARMTALAWTTLAAARAGQETLIWWSERPSDDAADDRIDPPAEAGMRFSIRSACVDVQETP